MTIVIEDISRTEQLDREELSSVRGGIAAIPVDSPPGNGSGAGSGPVSMPPFLPSGFPFNGSSPLDPGRGGLDPDPGFSPPSSPGYLTTQPAQIDLKNQ